MAAKTEKSTPESDGASICPVCWPDGWPDTAVTGGCEHGSWQREQPPADSSTAGAVDEAEK